MLEVWGRRNSSNVIPVMWAVGELGIPHRRHDVGGSFGGLDTPDYKAMNPNARVPTIKDEGFVLWESNAIIRYLARRYGQGGLLPDDEQQIALADQWLEWCKTTPYPDFIGVFWGIVRTKPDQRKPQMIKARLAAWIKQLQLLDRHLADRAFVVGDRLSMADIPLGAMAYRYFNLPIQRPDFPGLAAWYQRLTERPAFQQHAMIPFGRNPAEWQRLEREGAAG